MEKEDPPLLGIWSCGHGRFANAKFVPAFRNGQPVACQVVLPVYSPKNRQSFNLDRRILGERGNDSRNFFAA